MGTHPEQEATDFLYIGESKLFLQSDSFQEEGPILLELSRLASSISAEPTAPFSETTQRNK